MDTLFWFSSKIFWALFSPNIFLFLMLLVGSLLLYTKRKSLGSWLVSSVTGFILIINVFPVGDLVIIPLEERFPQPTLPEKVDGIIVLGGSEEALISINRGQPTVDASAERLFAFIYLAREYPNAKLVFTGGAGGLGSNEYTHSDTARKIFEQSGLDVNKIIFESRSKNTYQNAVYSFDLVKPQKGEKWVLVTSAFHIPRVMGVFRKINWEIIPYPVDYQTAGLHSFKSHYKGLAEVEKVAYGLREWLGLLAYWAMGKTTNLFPKPYQSESVMGGAH